MATPTGSIRLVLCLLGPSGLLLRLVLLVGSGSVYGMAYGMGSRQAGRRLAGWARRARATDGARHGQLSADLEAGWCTSTSTGGPISRTAACSVCSACSVLPFLSSPCFLPAHGFRFRPVSAAGAWVVVVPLAVWAAAGAWLWHGAIGGAPPARGNRTYAAAPARDAAAHPSSVVR